jgi:biotin carboxyl carrier protein
MSNEIIFIQNARISFPNLIEPQVREKEDGSKIITYNCDLILPPDHAGYKAFMLRFQSIANEMWKDRAQGAMQQIHADRKSRCYGLGEERKNSKTFEVYSGYAGNVYISASRSFDPVKNTGRPQIIKENGQAVDAGDLVQYAHYTRQIYAGCYVNAAIKPWAQKNVHGNGIRCELVAIQFAKDGEPFGEAEVDVSGMFGAVAGGQPASGVTFNPIDPSLTSPAPAMPGLPSFLGGN